MRKTCVVAAVLALGLAARTPGVEERAEPSRGTPGELDAKISLDLNGAAIGDVIRTLEELSGLRIAASPRTSAEPVTLSLERVRLRTILDALCDGADCTWSLDGRSRPATIRVAFADPSGAGSRASAPVSIDQPITLSLDDADARDVLRASAKLLGAISRVDTGVCGSVSVDIRKMPMSKFLDEVCREVRCTWKLDRSPTTAVLRVARLPRSG